MFQMNVNIFFMNCYWSGPRCGKPDVSYQNFPRSQMWKTRCFSQMFLHGSFCFWNLWKNKTGELIFEQRAKILRGKTELHPNQFYGFKTSYHCLENALIWNISAPHFLAFLLNNSLRIQSEWGKIRTWKFPNTDNFYAVENSVIIRQIRRFID